MQLSCSLVYSVPCLSSLSNVPGKHQKSATEQRQPRHSEEYILAYLAW